MFGASRFARIVATHSPQTHTAQALLAKAIRQAHTATQQRAHTNRFYTAHTSMTGVQRRHFSVDQSSAAATPISTPVAPAAAAAAASSVSAGTAADAVPVSSDQGVLTSTAESEEHESDEPPPGSSWWQRWSHERPFPVRGTSAWYREVALVCLVFSITGSSSMFIVRPALKEVGIDGTMANGPWSYRLACIGVLMPAYSCMLLTFGTLFGRHHYFKRIALRMWGRLLPLHKLGITSKPAPVPRVKGAAVSTPKQQ